MSEKSSMNLSRRRFFPAAGGILATGGSAALAADSVPRWNQEADVVIVGGGGTGCLAAVSAIENGAKVIVVESAPVLGGACSLCIGAVTAPLSGLQKKAGIADSVDAYMEDIMKLADDNASRMDKTLLRLLAENGGPTLDWLIGLGVDLRGPFDYPLHRVKRMHMLYPKSAEWPKVIRPLLERKGAGLLLGVKGVELYRGDGNRVLGVKVVDQNTGRPMAIKARRAVMLTAGNLEANPVLMQRVTTADVAALPAAVPTNDGAGLMMAAALGAGMTMLDNGAVALVRGAPPGPAVDIMNKQAWQPFGLVDAGAIVVNKAGRRFANEEAHGTPARPGNPLCLALSKQPYKTCYLVFDKRMADNFQKWPMILALVPGIGDVSGLGGWATVDDLVARTAIKKADTIEELATAIGVDPAGLKAEVETWNNYCRAGKDPQFNRQAFGHKDANTLGTGIKVPPFYCHSPLRTLVTPGDTSVAINTNLQVIDVFGKVIPGLYAGGVMGHGNLLFRGTGYGIHMAWAFTSGRLGGRNAAAEKPWA
jgi:fumarate reductase flavoprotein subunit